MDLLAYEVTHVPNRGGGHDGDHVDGSGDSYDINYSALAGKAVHDGC